MSEELWRKEVCARIARAALNELRGRKGFGGWWDTIDPDTQGEIEAAVAECAGSVLIEAGA